MNTTMDRPVSIAIETSSGCGGVAVGRGDDLCRAAAFPAHSRHATQLICRLEELLSAESLGPTDVEEIYVSAGPGSFTGLRIGITVARTLAQALGHVRCVSVPTAAAVAENVRDRKWRNLAVIFEARDELVHATIFERRDGCPAPVGRSQVATLPEVLADAPRPLLVIASGKPETGIDAEDVTLAAEPAIPTAEGVWRAGRRLARLGRFTDPLQLLPAYARRPEAVRLWEKRHGRQDGDV